MAIEAVEWEVSWRKGALQAALRFAMVSGLVGRAAAWRDLINVLDDSRTRSLNEATKRCARLITELRRHCRGHGLGADSPFSGGKI